MVPRLAKFCWRKDNILCRTCWIMCNLPYYVEYHQLCRKLCTCI